MNPAHFCTAPGLAWQALLKTATEFCEHEKRRKDCELCPYEFRFELLSDIEMLLMVEKSIRSGIMQAVKRYSRVNNKYMKDLYNPENPYTILKRACIFSTWMQTTFTDGRLLTIYQRMDLNGRRR